MHSIIDQDIEHIANVMPKTLQDGFTGSQILPAPYWRVRLYRLLGEYQLTISQFSAIDDLLGQLDRFDMVHPVEQDRRWSRSRWNELRCRSATTLPLRSGNTGSANGVVKTRSAREGRKTTGPAVIKGIRRPVGSDRQPRANIIESGERGAGRWRNRPAQEDATEPI